MKHKDHRKSSLHIFNTNTSNERSNGERGETTRIIRLLVEAFELNGESRTAPERKEFAERILKNAPSDHFDDLLGSDTSYAMMRSHTFSKVVMSLLMPTKPDFPLSSSLGSSITNGGLRCVLRCIYLWVALAH